MWVIWTSIVGLVVGVLTNIAFPSRDPRGMLFDGGLGTAAAGVAGLVAHALGLYKYPGDVPGLLVSVVGALIALFALRIVSRRRQVV